MKRSAAAVLARAVVSPSSAAGTMGKTEQKPSAEPGKVPEESEGEGVERAFDLWLQRGLHQLYDTVTKEPVPEELLRLIEEDRTSKD